jgi:YVTN family beta-propeller protein
LLVPILLLLVGLWTGTSSAVPFAYISNSASNDVSVIDIATDTLVATVPVGSGPYGVAASQVLPRVYVTNSTGGSVSVIDTVTNTVVATVPVGTGPQGVAVTPAGTRVYVSNFFSDTVSVIDTTTNTVMATVPVGVAPLGVAVNPAGTRAYVVNNLSNKVSVIDTSVNAVISTVFVGNTPGAVAVNPSGTRLYVTSQGTSSLWVIDTDTNAVVATVPVGNEPVAVALNPAGTRAYVTNRTPDNNVSIIDTGTNLSLATIRVGVNPVGVQVNPTGTRVYMASQSANLVSILDTASNTLAATVFVGTSPRAFGTFIAPGNLPQTSGPGEADPLSPAVGGALLPFFGNGAAGDVSILEVSSPVGPNPGLQATFFDASCTKISGSVGLPLATNDVAIFPISAVAPNTNGLVALAGTNPAVVNLPIPLNNPIHSRVYWFNAFTGRARVLEPITLRQLSGTATWNPLRTGATFFAPAVSGMFQAVLYLICPKYTIQSTSPAVLDQAFPPADGFSVISPPFQTGYPIGSIRGRIYDLGGGFIQDIVTDCDCNQTRPLSTLSTGYTNFGLGPHNASNGTFTELESAGGAADFAFTGYKALSVPGSFIDLFGRLSGNSRTDVGGAGASAGNR